MIEELGGQHDESMIIVRYVKFLQNIIKSSKWAVQFLLQQVKNDLSTLTGRNIRFILDKIGHDKDIFKVKANVLKSDLKFCEIEENEKWRVRFAQEIVNVKQRVLTIDQDEDSFPSDERLQEILDYICSG